MSLLLARRTQRDFPWRGSLDPFPCQCMGVCVCACVYVCVCVKVSIQGEGRVCHGDASPPFSPSAPQKLTFLVSVIPFSLSL